MRVCFDSCSISSVFSRGLRPLEGFVVCLLVNQTVIHRKRREQRPHTIVEITGNSPALLFLRRD